MPAHWIQNAIVVALLAGGVGAARHVARNRLWREAARSLWRRRPIALVVVAFYVAIGLADSVQWIGGGASVGQDVVAAHEARSVIDRVFGQSRETTYSAPLAGKQFYSRQELLYPGRHLLGTDILGRDTLYRTLKGVRVALLVGGLTCLIAIPLALAAGVSAGYFGGRVDDLVFFVMSTLSSIPTLLLLLAIIMALGRGTVQVCFALGVTGWVGLCRVTRAETLKLREADYVNAARALGVSDLRILFRHILPNLAHLVIITFVLLFTGEILAEAILAFLGVGIDGSWGQMLDQARDELAREPIVWWNVVSAGVAMFVLLLAVNFVADSLRDVLDPRTLREND